MYLDLEEGLEGRHLEGQTTTKKFNNNSSNTVRIDRASAPKIQKQLTKDEFKRASKRTRLVGFGRGFCEDIATAKLHTQDVTNSKCDFGRLCRVSTRMLPAKWMSKVAPTFSSSDSSTPRSPQEFTSWSVKAFESTIE